MATSFPPPSTSSSGRDERAEQARALCLRLLTARARTRAQLAAALGKRGYAETVVNEVLDRLAQAGLVDDEDFARQWVRSRRIYAGKGKRALAAELHVKGVDREVIEATLSGIDAGAERARAEELVRVRLRREKLHDPGGADDRDLEIAVTRRLVGMLARRGYGQTMALDVVRAELAGERERRRV